MALNDLLFWHGLICDGIEKKAGNSTVYQFGEQDW